MLNKALYGWWQQAVFYQIYPKSFLDTTGSGVGDLQGIIQKLDYLQTLGIDGIWLSPVCQSPQADNGYDISDYCAIDPMFGTMQDMEMLIAEAKKRNISILVDLVLNHSSEKHPWFLGALEGEENPYHDFYIWRSGKEIPNDMGSVFGGPAWTYVERLNKWYFHQFSPQQPDLNWENPKLRQALYNCIRFWVEKGVEGFRLDVIDQIAKEPDNKITINGPRLMEYLQELHDNAFPEEGIVTVGEAWGADPQRAKAYTDPENGPLSMVFQFQHMQLDQQGEKWDENPLSLPELKAVFARWQQQLHGKGWNSLFLNNHDLPRIVSRWGDTAQYRVESAKALATMLHGMEGTPYIYQGEELGMTNIRLPIEDYADVETKNLYQDRIARGYSHGEVMESIYRRGRDNARTPMQWTAGEHAGFTKGTPWLPVNENHGTINAEAALADPDSIFYHYQKLIALRKTVPALQTGRFQLLLPEHPQIFAYTRQREGQQVLVVCNLSSEEAAFDAPAGQVLLSNYPEQIDYLRPWESYILAIGG
jgi:glucan 1,6-alpha-glucosidase